jgi:hypothetical protein
MPRRAIARQLVLQAGIVPLHSQYCVIDQRGDFGPCGLIL